MNVRSRQRAIGSFFLLAFACSPTWAAADKPQLTRSVRSGNWSDPATWQAARLPAAGDLVLVRTGHTVVYDVNAELSIRILKIAGTLRFATDRDTRLEVGLIRVEAGEEVSEEGFDCDAHLPAIRRDSPPTLMVGSPSAPIEADRTARIRLKYFAGMNPDSCPAIVNCGGRMEFHGAPMNRTWVKLGNDAEPDAHELTLAEPVKGWRPGHRVLIPSTERLSLFGEQRKLIPTVRDETHTEERTILAVVGNRLILDEALEYKHVGSGDFRGEAANLSRNVIVESADPNGVRGHTMYHVNSTGSISYAEFRNLGKKGVLGRYSLHFHLCGDTARGSSVIGASIHDSDNRWLTIHGTNYLVVRDCVGYNSLGHGFFLEDGTEVFNVFDRNLAVQARHAAPLPKQVLPYDENEGAGFWWANSLNSFTRNVAAECDQYGFRFEATKTPDFDPVLPVLQVDGQRKKIDIRTLPFVRFQDNEAHTQRRFAFNLGGIRHVSDETDYRAVRTPGADLSRIQGGDVAGVGPDTAHPFIVRNFRVWNSQWVFHGGSPSVLIDGLQAKDCVYGIFKTRMDAHEYRGLRMTGIDTADIFEPWGNSTIAENYHRYLDDRRDDQPPVSVILRCDRLDGGKVRVRGTTCDNGPIKRVMVNQREATALDDNFSSWEVIVSIDPKQREWTAVAEDAVGNVEVHPHRVQWMDEGNSAQP